MTAPLLSPLWYRIAYLKPRLKSGVRVARHEVRGRTWFVLTDPVSGQHHRFDPAAYALVAACEGHATIDEIWSRRVDAESAESADGAVGDQAPTQAQAIEVFSQAFAANLLAGDVVADARAAMRAQRRKRSRERRGAIHPLSFKLPLWNPDAWLDRHAHRTAWLFGTRGVQVLLAAMLAGALLFAVQADVLARDAARHLDQGRVMLLLWLAYPAMKLVHELAHAFAVKVYGGDVAEMGVAVLLLTPVPYVDASAASAFESKRRRAVVAGAGIAVEWLLASAALLAWTLAEPGLMRDAALAVAVIGGVSTLVVNGNPLLRFDGYHVLCDVLELPNLAPRSARWWHAVLQRAVLGRRAADTSTSATPEPATGRERAWLVAYAPASWLVRCTLTLALAFALARWNTWVGLAMLALATWWMVGAPAFAALRWFASSPAARDERSRVLGITAAATTAVLAFAFLAPLPHRTLAPGVVWLPDEALVRPASDGFVDAVLVADGQDVDAGTLLVRLRNEPLELALADTAAQLQEARIEHVSMLSSDLLRAAQAADRVQALEAEHHRAAARVAALDLRAGVAGRVAIDPRRLVPGRWLTQGDAAAYVLAPGAATVRALVAHEDMLVVRDTHPPVQVTLAHADTPTPARWLRSVPAASRRLVTAALGTAGGGTIAVDAIDTHGLTALEPRFEVELQLPDDTRAHVGERAWVAFDHGASTLASLSVQFLRRTFLRHFASGAQA